MTGSYGSTGSYVNFKERKVLLLNLHGLTTNILAFSLTFLVFWAFWKDKRKIENHQKKKKFAIEMLTCHVDGLGYVEKHFFGCVS